MRAYRWIDLERMCGINGPLKVTLAFHFPCDDFVLVRNDCQ